MSGKRRFEHLGKLGLILGVVCLLMAFQIVPVSASAKHQSRPLGIEAVGECTVSTPAIANMTIGSTAYFFVGWVGCDSAHSLNVEGSTDGVHWGACVTYCSKRVLNEQSWSDSNLEAGLVFATWNGHLYLAWVGTNAHLNVGFYNWTSTVQSKVTLSSYSSHYTLALASDNTSSGSALYLAYTGTDAHLYFLHSSNGTSWSTQVKGNDTAAAAPGLAQWSSSPYGDHVYVAWRGTDSAHRLYMGYFNGTATLSNHVGLSNCVSTGCYVVPATGDVALTDGQNGHIYVSFPSDGDIVSETGDNTAIGKSGDGYNFTFNISPFYGHLGTLGIRATYRSPYIWETFLNASKWNIDIESR